MSLYKETLDEIKRRKANLESGGINAIPFPLPAFSQYVPGIMKGTQFGITGDSGASKSKLLRYLFVQTPFDFYYANRDKYDIDIEIFLFTLEDNNKMTMKNIIVAALSKYKNIRISPLMLNSDFQNRSLPTFILKEIESMQDYFELLLSKVHIIDDIFHPTGILKVVKKRLLDPDNGNYVDEHGNKVETDKEGNIIPSLDNSEKFRQLKYVPKNPNKFVIVLTDNLQNIRSEKGNDNKWDAYDRFCRQYMRSVLCNTFDTCNCIVQQQEKSSGKAQFTNTGNQVVEKLLPTVAGLAEYKNSVDSAHCLLGIFNPYKYRVEHFQAGANNWYDIIQLGDMYRNISILKSNFAETVNTSVLFDSFSETFTELPNGNNTEEMQKVYNFIYQLKTKSKESFLF